MRRYLDKSEVISYLNLNKSIEIFLGRIRNDKEIISYLILTKNIDDLIETKLFDHYDEGDSNYTDIYDFSYVDPDMNFETNTFENIDQCVEFIQTKFHINHIRFVNEGISQDEYADFIRNEGLS